MLPQEVQGLFGQARAHLADGRAHLRAHHALHDARSEDLRQLQQLVAALTGATPGSPAGRGAIGGSGVARLAEDHLATLVRARMMLRHHEQYLGQVAGWLNQFEWLHDHFEPLLQGAMSMVPGPIWGFLSETCGLALPSLGELLLQGPAVMPNPQAHWDAWQSEAEAFLLGLSGGVLGGVGQLLSSWGLSFYDGSSTGDTTGDQSGLTVHQVHAQVSSALWEPSRQLTAYATAVQQSHQQVQQAHAAGCCQPDTTYTYTYPPYPTGPTLHSKADLQQRAQRIHDIVSGLTVPLYDDQALGYQQLAPYLQDLSPDDVQALENLYALTYHSSLYYDLYEHLETRPEEWYRITQALHPEYTRQQDNLNATANGPTHIVLNPPLPVAPVGTFPHYQIWDADQHKLVTASNVFVMANADAQKNGAPAQLNMLQLASGGFPAPGTYTVVVEVPPTDNNQPPHFITYQQTVLPASTVAVTTLFALSDPQDWPSPQDYLSGLRKAAAKNSSLNGAVSRAQGLLTPDCVPIEAAYVARSGTTQTIPLTLYVKPLPGGRWEVVDLTNPLDIRTYDGSSPDDAWHNFIQNNPMPKGQLVALPPKLQGGQFSWKLWNKPNDDHSLQRDVSGWLAALSLVTFVVGFVFPPAFIVSGLAGGVSGVLDIADQVQHGDWSWDPQHGLEIAGTVLSFGIGIGGALKYGPKLIASIADFASSLNQVGTVTDVALDTATTGGKTSLTITGVAKTTFTVGGKIITKGSTFTMVLLMAGPDAQAAASVITRDLQQGKSWQDVLSDLWQTLSAPGLGHYVQLAAVGFPFLMDEATALKSLADRAGTTPEALQAFFDDVNTGKVTDIEAAAAKYGLQGLPADLIQQIASTPTLQAALAGLGPDGLSTLYSEYQSLYGADIAAGNNVPTFDAWVTTPQYTIVPFSTDGSLPNDGGNRAVLSPYQQLRLARIMSDVDGNITNQVGLTPSQLADFRNLVRTDSRMQMLLATVPDIKTAEQFYKDWCDGRANGTITFKGFTDPNDGFYRYVAQIQHTPIDLGAPGTEPPNPIEVALPTFMNASVTNRELLILQDAYPDVAKLYASLPDGDPLKDAIATALTESEGTVKDVKVGATYNTEYGIRAEFVKAFNQNLGTALGQIPDPVVRAKTFRQAMAAIDNQSSRGSIGEWFLYTLCGGEGSGIVRHPTFSVTSKDIAAIRQAYGSEIPPAVAAKLKAGDALPDMMTMGKNGVDVKTFTTSNIDEAQLLEYAQLMKDGSDGTPLVDGRNTGGITKLNYVILPGNAADGTAAEAAKRVLATIKKYGLQNDISVYYMDENGQMMLLDPITGASTQVASYTAVFQ